MLWKGGHVFSENNTSYVYVIREEKMYFLYPFGFEE